MAICSPGVTHLRDTVAIHLIVKSGERSTPCGCPFFSHVVEGRSPEDPWTSQRKQSRDPGRVSHLCLKYAFRDRKRPEETTSSGGGGTFAPLKRREKGLPLL